MPIGRVRRSLRIRSAWALALAAPVAAAAQSDCPRGVLPAYSHDDSLHARPLAGVAVIGTKTPARTRALLLER